jgi:hypothetical protein
LQNEILKTAAPRAFVSAQFAFFSLHFAIAFTTGTPLPDSRREM